jgi:hypothetical protein
MGIVEDGFLTHGAGQPLPKVQRVFSLDGVRPNPDGRQLLLVGRRGRGG